MLADYDSERVISDTVDTGKHINYGNYGVFDHAPRDLQMRVPHLEKDTKGAGEIFDVVNTMRFQRLDNLTQRQLMDEEIDFIKVDIEGESGQA